MNVAVGSLVHWWDTSILCLGTLFIPQAILNSKRRTEHIIQSSHWTNTTRIPNNSSVSDSLSLPSARLPGCNRTEALMMEELPWLPVKIVIAACSYDGGCWPLLGKNLFSHSTLMKSWAMRNLDSVSSSSLVSTWPSSLIFNHRSFQKRKKTEKFVSFC